MESTNLFSLLLILNRNTDLKLTYSLKNLATSIESQRLTLKNEKKVSQANGIWTWARIYMLTTDKTELYTKYSRSEKVNYTIYSKRYVKETYMIWDILLYATNMCSFYCWMVKALLTNGQAKYSVMEKKVGEVREMSCSHWRSSMPGHYQ